MARSRNIKPSFFFDEELAKLPERVRLLYIGLWCLADRNGVIEDRPEWVRAQIFPYDAAPIGGDLGSLSGWLYRYTRDGKGYIRVKNFTQHQSPHHTEKETGFPVDGDTEVIPPLPHGGNPPDSLIPDSLIPDSNDGRTGKESPAKSLSKNVYPEEFEKFWEVYPKQQRKNKPDALKAWNAAKKKSPTDEIIAGLIKFSKTEEGQGKYCPWPQKWLNQERWKEDFEESTPVPVQQKTKEYDPLASHYRDSDPPELRENLAIMRRRGEIV